VEYRAREGDSVSQNMSNHRHRSTLQAITIAYRQGSDSCPSVGTRFPNKNRGAAPSFPEGSPGEGDRKNAAIADLSGIPPSRFPRQSPDPVFLAG
jgi:hypothetical protein